MLFYVRNCDTQTIHQIEADDVKSAVAKIYHIEYGSRKEVVEIRTRDEKDETLFEIYVYFHGGGKYVYPTGYVAYAI